MDLVRIGLGTSKAAFTLHGVDHDEKAGLRRNIKRAEMEAFLAKLPPPHVALEACGGSHHGGRRLAFLGRTVQLIPPQHVKPSVRRGKNDRNDAEAVSKAARPGRRCRPRPSGCWRSWAGKWPSSTGPPKRAAFAAGTAELERRTRQPHKASPVSQLLAEVPGIGPIGALSLAPTIDPGRRLGPHLRPACRAPWRRP